MNGEEATLPQRFGHTVLIRQCLCVDLYREASCQDQLSTPMS